MNFILFHYTRIFKEKLIISALQSFAGPFLLTHLLLPLLNKSENGRVINVSASAHFNGNITIDNENTKKGLNVKDSFAASKLALTIITKHMARLCYGMHIVRTMPKPRMCSLFL